MAKFILKLEYTADQNCCPGGIFVSLIIFVNVYKYIRYVDKGYSFNYASKIHL